VTLYKKSGFTMNKYEEKLLKEYAQEHNINNMTSEEIMKLIEKPYIIKET